MELFASAPGLAVEESYVRLLNHLPGLAYRCRVGRTDPIVSERLEYTLEFVSKGSYDLLGIPAEDMVRNNNNTIERMMHPDDLQKTRRNMYDSIVAHQPYQVMYRVSLPSGRLKWIWDQGEGVFDADGELFRKVVKSAFAMRRKILSTCLASGLGISKEKAAALIEMSGHSPSVRGETLSAEDFAVLTNVIKNNM